MEELVMELLERIKRLERTSGRVITATYVSAEAVDGNLSVLRLPVVSEITGTDEVRFVPKYAHVTGLTAGTRVYCWTNPFIIIGIPEGDVTLAVV